MKQRFILTDKQLSFLTTVSEHQRGEGPADARDPSSALSKRVNAAWELIGRQCGFDGATADEVDGMSPNHILATATQSTLGALMDGAEDQEDK